MPKSFLVKKSSSSPIFAHSRVQEEKKPWSPDSVLENTIKWEPFDVSEYENGVETATSVIAEIDNSNCGPPRVREIPISVFRNIEGVEYENAFARELSVHEFKIKQEFSQEQSLAQSYCNGRHFGKFYQDPGTFQVGHRELPVEIAQFKTAEQMIETRDRDKTTLEHANFKETHAQAQPEDKKSSAKKAFKCDHCVMSFTRPSDLQRHLLIHSNTKPYKCEECDREFTWFGNYQKHMLSHVNSNSNSPGSSVPFSTMFTLLARDQLKDLFVKDGEKYKCRLCSKDFTRLSGLKTHIRMHTGERPFVCDVCSFAFTTSRALKMHTRLHTGEKPYKCEVCERAFTRRDEMHTHMYIHKGEKPFKCNKCSASFIRYGHLQRHMLIHSDDKPYKCKLCTKSFTQYRNLQTHMYKHTGERPYKCQYCPKGFTQFGTLQAHERTHTGEKPFSCSICDKAFITSSHLRWHIKTQHTKE